MAKKLLLLTLCILTLAGQAQAATYHFSTSGSNSTGTGTSGNPYHSRTGLSITINDGDILLLKRDDEWCGSNIAEWILGETNTPGAGRALLGAYGFGEAPIIAGACVTTPTWVYTGANGIWYTAGQTQGTIKIVSVDDDDEVNRYALNRVGIATAINNNALPAGIGTYCRAASTTAGASCTNVSGAGSNLFIRLPDDSDPNDHNFRIGSYTHNSGNGDRGIIRTTSAGDYWDVVDIDVRAVNGIGVSNSGYGWRMANIDGFALGRDGYLSYCNNTGAEDGSYGRMFRSKWSWSSMYGRGNGQGMTDYCNNNAYLTIESHHHAMAPFDTLDLGTTTTVSNIVTIDLNAHHGGTDYDSGSFDSAIYNDGGHDIVHYNAKGWASGIGTGGGANERYGFISGSERPTTEIAENVDCVDCWLWGINGKAFGLDNPTSSTVAMGVHRIWNSTLESLQSGAGSTDRAMQISDTPTTANLLQMFGNIIRGNSSATIVNASTALADTILDANYNLYSRVGGSTTIFTRNSVGENLATWAAGTGEDANSIVGDPLFVTDPSVSESAPDFNLQDGSPAIDACGTNADYTPYSWLTTSFSDIFPTTASKMPGRGTTRASGALDDPTTAMDCGAHKSYRYVYAATVTPATLEAQTNTTVTVSFQLPDTAFLYNDYLEVTLTGYTLNSGGSTAVTSISGFNGSTSVGTSGAKVTLTRSGDGYSAIQPTVSFQITNVQTPEVGLSGAPLIELYSDDIEKIATSEAEYGMAISGSTFVSPNPSPRYPMSGIKNMKGVIFR